MTVHERVAAARARLKSAGIPADDAELDARLLAMFALGWDTARFVVSANQPEPSAFGQQFDTLVARRLAREPLAYITGRREFWGREIEVSPAVLIPRPETELIVEQALKRLPNREAPLDIADVGTGSGCLAIALALERPRSRILAIDVSDPALEVARRNAKRQAVSGQIEFTRGDLLNGVTREFDLIVSNPPYVPERDRSTLQPEVRDHEPPAALFAGTDGLSVIRALAGQAANHLKPHGALIFEFGFGQAGEIRRLISTTVGLALVDLVNDLQAIPRIAVAQKVRGQNPENLSGLT